MKIVHICITAPYLEGMGYQENIIARIHKEEGHDIHLITADYAFYKNGNKISKNIGTYINPDGINIYVLKRKAGFLSSKLRTVTGIREKLNNIKPDIIFVHGGQFIGLKEVIKYCKKNSSVKLFIDQHADYYNSPVKKLTSWVLSKGIYGHYIRKAAKYVRTFWGVTPWRCEYLNDIYGVPKNKIKLLPMGGDDDKIHLSNKEKIRKSICNELQLEPDDFVIVTGGKIDRAKNIHLLIQAVAELNRDNVKLIVFGQPSDDMNDEIEKLSKDTHIRNIGWLQADRVYDYFLASDLVAFPGTHSVLWEQACACGVPCIFKDWEGMHHVDLGENCIFLKNDSKDEILNVLKNIIDTDGKYESMKKSAEKGIEYFSYKKIAKRAIEETI